MYGQARDLEDEPSREQKSRMDDFLYELREISRRYQMVLDADIAGAGTALVDARNDKVVGIDLHYLLDDEDADTPRVAGYDCDLSIRDGLWLVKGPGGDQVEQGEVDGSMWQRRNVRR